MIVRDEAHVVAETLACVAPHLDAWVVVDTGSTDATREIVRSFFAQRDLPGDLVERPWVDFGSNRSEALALCRGRADYAWVIDADDLVVGRLDLSGLTADAVHLRYGPDVVYWRAQLFRTARRFRYAGVVHEYPVCDDGPFTEARLEGGYHVISRRLGARSRDPGTYRKDAVLLEAALARDPGDTRSQFYLAQSRRDAGDDPAALEAYLRRAAMGGWDEEVFFSLLQAARCRERLGHPFESVLEAYLDSARARPSRAEALVDAARLCRLNLRWDLAARFAAAASALPFPASDALFVDAGATEWRALDEAAIAACQRRAFREGLDLCTTLLLERDVPDAERARIEANRDLCVPHLLEETAAYPPATVALLVDRLKRPDAGPPEVTLTLTSCRRLDLFERTVNSFLNCCEDLHRIGRFVCVDDSSSPADRQRMAARYPFFEFVWKDAGEAGHARSMNRILELLDGDYWLHLEDDWQFFVRAPWVTRAIAVLEDDSDVGQVLFNRNYAETLDDRDIAGGEVRKARGGVRYRLHTHFPSGGTALAYYLGSLPPGSRTNAWWPHYSLRPSLLRVEAVRDVGAYDEGSDHFERDFARRWTDLGIESAFFDLVTCLHTGTLTSERGPARRPNAYDLNLQPQFGARREPAATLRVRPLGDWATPAQLVRHWRRQAGPDGTWDGVVLTESGDADYTVLFNRPGPGQAVERPERTVVFHMEPPHAVRTWGQWAAPDPRRFLQVRSHEHFLNVAEWHLGRTGSELAAEPIVKSRDLSAVVSGKLADPGQQLRVAFLRHLEAQGVGFDLYGTSNPARLRSYRGTLPPSDKSAGIFPYRYTLAAENSAHVNYATEKLWDALLGECLPFYWGCPDLEEHVDPEAFIRVPLEDPGAACAIVREAIRTDQWSRRLPAIRREKRRILNELQLFPVLARTLRGHRLVESLGVRVLNLDRRPDRLSAFRSAFAAAAGERFAARCSRVAAVDGVALALTDEIRHTFRGNDFNFRRGIVGCALSHLALWRELASRDDPAWLVFEDDARVCQGFAGQLVEVAGRVLESHPRFDLVLLGYHAWTPDPRDDFAASRRPPTVREMPWSSYLGGCFGYLVSRAGAARLLALADRDGIQNGIDWFMMYKGAELEALACTPHLVTSPLAVPGSPTDSDIQHDHVALS